MAKEMVKASTITKMRNAPNILGILNGDITVSKAFPTAKLKNAYDDIKGRRRSVFIEEEKEDDYLTFILAHGWYGCSMTLQLMGYNQKEKLGELFERVKREYPECLKRND